MAYKQVEGQTMTEEQGALVTDEEFRKYIDSIAESFYVRAPSVGKDEFFGIGMAAACEVAMRYDPTKGYAFTTFCTMYVRGMMTHHINKYVRSAYVDKHDRMFAKMFSIDQMQDEDGEMLNGEEVLSSGEIEAQERRDAVLDRVDGLLSGLSKEDRELLEMRFRFDGDKEAFKKYIESQGKHYVTIYRHTNEIIADIAKKTTKKK